MLCFRNLLVAKKFEDKKLGVVSKFYVKTFLSQRAEKFRRGTRNPSVLCFRKFLLAKIFMDNKGGVSQISVGNFCLTVPKKFVGEPFTLSLASGTKIIYASEGYVTIIRRKFLSHSTETIPRGTLLCSVSEKFWWRKSLWIRRGEYHNFPSEIFVSQCRKNS